MPVSQKQIAEKLGVSIALVSRVLSGKAAKIGITQEKIDQVLQTADEMGYVPSAAALGLIGKSTRTIGIAVYDFNDPFFGTLIQAIQTQAHKHDFSLILTGFLNRIPDQQDLRALHKHTLDGLIVIGTDEDAGWLEDFKHLPVVRIGHGPKEEKSTIISVDEAASARSLVEHLLKTGRNRLAYVGANLPAHKIRLEALQSATKAASVELVVRATRERDAYEAGKEVASGILKGHSRTNALVCATDRAAMGALNILHGKGISVPGQLALTGFDDIPDASRFIPSITTIRQPVAKMAEAAFRSVIKGTSPGRIDFPGRLMIRQTT
jgi:LacI family transcriptional regulator